MNRVNSPSQWRTFCLCAFWGLTFGLTQPIRVEAADRGQSGSGLPEEILLEQVTQLSDALATKIQSASCPDMVQLLDQIKNANAKPADPDSLITKVLNDVKTNPKLKGVVIQKLSEPLLNRLLDCNMVPLDLLAPTSP
ncbi:MAG TPA: hypothetical protein V6D19_01310 [Stenomitos sp.]